MANVRMLLLMVVLIAKPDRAYQLILDSFPGLPPCSATVNGRDVFCYGKEMTKLPPINYLNITNGNSLLNLHLANNQIEILSTLFFQNLSNLTIGELALYLQNNSMNYIEFNAFGGIEDEIIAINLDNNNLTEIPSELRKLNNLRSLFLNNNPISRLETSVLTLRTIGRSLKTLSIDLQHFKSWPQELKYLHLLSNLTLLNIKQTTLDFDTFDSFNGSLKSLYIKNSSLEKVPTSVCHLDNLLNLEFSHNYNVHLNSTWIEPSCRSLANLSSINMEHNNLHNMPNLPTIFNTEVVRLSHNRISSIESKNAADLGVSHTLILDHNNFTRIPFAIGWGLPNLTYLDMQYNDIRSIEPLDFSSGFLDRQNLEYLVLNYNPIEYVSLFPEQLTVLQSLHTLELSHTNIRTLPAFLSFPPLQYLNLESNPTECSCKLSYLKGWNITNVKIKGNCDKSPFTVKSFLMTDLPFCL